MFLQRRRLLFALVLVVAAASLVVYVPAGRAAVLEARGGAVTRLAPGFHLRVPLYQHLYVYDSVPVTIDDKIDVVSKDHASFKLPARISGHASPNDVLTFHRGRAGREPRVYIEERMREAVVAAARGFNADEILSPDIARRLGPLVSADLITRGISDDGLQVGSPSPQVVFNAVVDYLRRKYPASAHALADRALSPREPEFQVNLGSLKIKQGKTDEAIAIYQKALELRADNPLALFNLGAAYAIKRDMDKALEYFHRAERAGPPSHALFNSLAQAYEEKGQLQRAAEYLKRSLQVRPDQPDRQAELKRIEAQLKKKA